jgi:hypothetical protein
MPTIQAKEHQIKDVFSNEYAFSIPPYQRPYSWGVDQAEALFDDLVEASTGFSPGKMKHPVSPYFLGSIVLIKDDKSPESEVIDGQQRLTTLALLLSALRVAFDDPKQKQTFARLLFEEGDSLVGTKDRCRLTLRELDQFSKILAGPKVPDPQKKIATNCALLVDLVKKLPQEARDSLASFLLQQTYLVVVSTADLDSAFRIFSVLNDRGLDLTIADILKADIVGKIPAEQQDAYVERWEDAEESLGTDRFAELFPHIRMIYGRAKLRKTVLEGFRESVTSISQPRKFIDEELLPYTDAYSWILEATYNSSSAAEDTEINRKLRLLKRMGDTDWIPATLQFAREHKNSPAELATFLKDMERLVACLWLLRADVNERIARHGAILKAMEAKVALSDPSSPLQLTPEEKDNSLTVLNGNIYEISPKPKRTMILLRLDELLSSGEATYEYDRITVEHVLPQNPPADSEWTKWWPDEAQRAGIVHTLGNLALLNRSQNSAARNWAFETKKNKYFAGQTGTSPFAMTTEVLRAKEWTPEIYHERQIRFRTKLAQAWRLE